MPGSLLARLFRPLIRRLDLVRRSELDAALVHMKFNLEARMTTAEQTEAAANDKFAALLGTVIAEIKSLRANVEEFPGQLAQAIEDGDQARADALAADALADASRLDAYTAQLSDLYPADVPVVEVPDAGQPATPPADSGVVVPPADDVPAEDAPVEDAPVEDAPVEDAPAADEPVADEPVADAPADDSAAPADDTAAGNSNG
jgi:hypothetical protein